LCSNNCGYSDIRPKIFLVVSDFMAKITFVCPGCSAKLGFSDSSKLGKKIKCPKCQEIFVPEVASNDDLEDVEDEVEEDDQPKVLPRNRGRPTGAKKHSTRGKGGSSGSGSNLPLVIGGGLAVVVLAIAGMYFGGFFSNAPLPGPPGGVSAPATAMATPASPMPAPPSTAAAHNPPVAAATPPSISPPLAAPVSPRSTPSTASAASPGSAEKVFGLRWMPAETELLIHLKLADLWQAPLLKGALANPALIKQLDELQKQGGLAPSDIESVTLGISELTAAFSKSLAAAPAAKPLPGRPGFGQTPFSNVRPEDIHFVLVMKTKKPIDLKGLALTSPGAKLQEKDGKTYFEAVTSPAMPIAGGGWSPDANTVIFASTKDLFATMERGETATPRKEFMSIDTSPQLVIASIAVEELPPGFEGQPGVAEMQAAMKPYAIRMTSLGLSVTGGIALQVSALSGTDDGAKKLKAQVEKYIGEGRQLFELQKKTAVPLFAELGDMALKNLKLADQNQLVTISTNIPDSAQQKLEQLPQIVMMMAMTGGLGGGMGGFGKGPGATGGAGSPFGASAGDSGSPGMPETRLPGETEPVDAATSEGLPEGMVLSAKTAWGSGPLVGADGKPLSTVDILIEASGDGVETICAATGATSKTATADAGGSLKKSKRVPPGGIDAQKTFLPFDAERDSPLDHPPQTLRVKLSIDTPSAKATKIEVLEGSFKYLTTEKSQVMTIENAPQKALRPLSEPEFKAAGVKLRRGPAAATPEILWLEFGKEHFLGQVRGEPGELLSVTEVEKGKTIQKLVSSHEGGKFPEDFEISFNVYTNVKEHTVNFRFENIPLPVAELKPQTQAAQPIPQ
jgi:hypothetical protein